MEDRLIRAYAAIGHATTTTRSARDTLGAAGDDREVSTAHAIDLTAAEHRLTDVLAELTSIAGEVRRVHRLRRAQPA